ncbi:hypothetical protein V1514DRAFT_335372 [Lipomyces japonicus]|uniref:uncharacterized protein n=1 Tax=Lipomyces japonicus TaxID=56871 RepID=UPI0034CD28BD
MITSQDVIRHDDPVPEPMPDDILGRPYWLMRNLAIGLTSETGARVTLTLRIPVGLFAERRYGNNDDSNDLMGKKNLKSVDVKTCCCQMLIDGLDLIENATTNKADHSHVLLVQALKKFIIIMGKVEKLIGSVLSSSPSSARPTVNDHTAHNGSHAGNTRPFQHTGGLQSNIGTSSFTNWRKKLTMKTLSSLSKATATTSTINTGTSSSNNKSLNFVSNNSSSVSIVSKSNMMITTSSAGDGPYQVYGQALSCLFMKAQIMTSIPPKSSSSSSSSLSLSSSSSLSKQQQQDKIIEMTIKISQFFGSVVCQFALTDIGLLLDSHIKRASRYYI